MNTAIGILNLSGDFLYLYNEAAKLAVEKEHTEDGTILEFKDGSKIFASDYYLFTPPVYKDVTI